MTRGSDRPKRLQVNRAIHGGHPRQRTRPIVVSRNQQGSDEILIRAQKLRPASSPDHFAVTAQIDSKGRVRLPKKIQEAIAVAPGDSVFFNVDWVLSETPTLRVAKAINPLASMLDELAEDAERAYRAGQTIGFHELIDEIRAELRSGVDLDDAP